jgi:hypothetical protein
MMIGQDINDPKHGFTAPYRGTVATASYFFTVTVTPCVITNVVVGSTVSNIDITVGDA